MTIQIQTQLGYLEHTAGKLQLKRAPTYIFELACGCRVYEKEAVLKHTWADCDFQGADFWADRFMEEGRTTKHHIREDEIESVFGNVTITREELPSLKLRQEELQAECVWKNTDEYITILKDMGYPSLRLGEITLMEEKELAERIKAWYLKENLIPPEYEILHQLAISRLAIDAIVKTFELQLDCSELVLFGN